MRDFKSFFKTVEGNEGQKCHYSTRLDTYGCGCFHDCKYCYAKSLLDFRKFWHPDNPSVADINKIESKIKTLKQGSLVRLGGMTDCFQPCESDYKVTFKTIQLLNKYGIHYLIVTKSDMVANDEYIKILDKKLAHIQITVTCTDDNFAKTYERATVPSLRIQAIEKLQKNGFDVAIRLSPFIPEYIDFDILNKINCNKIVVEFLRVNGFIRKTFELDYSAYTHIEGGYCHLPLETKKNLINNITGFEQISVCEDCTEAYNYWKANLNYNPSDCCNLTFTDGNCKYMGNLKLLKNKKVAFLSSQKSDLTTIDKAKIWAKSQSDSSVSVISGFQSKLEQIVLKELVNNNANIVLVLSRDIFGNCPVKYKKLVESGKMLIISPFDSYTKNVTRESSKHRNAYILDLSEGITIGDITKGGMLEELLEGKQYVLLGKKL